MLIIRSDSHSRHNMRAPKPSAADLASIFPNASATRLTLQQIPSKNTCPAMNSVFSVADEVDLRFEKSDEPANVLDHEFTGISQLLKLQLGLPIGRAGDRVAGGKCIPKVFFGPSYCYVAMQWAILRRQEDRPAPPNRLRVASDRQFQSQGIFYYKSSGNSTTEDRIEFSCRKVCFPMHLTIRARRDIRAARISQQLNSSERQRWQVEYARRLAVADLAVVCSAVGAAQFIRFGGPVDPPLAGQLPYTVGYSFVSAVLAIAWAAILAGSLSHSLRVIGCGIEEYRRLVSSTVWLFGLIAIVSLILRVDIARGYLAIALPIGLLGLIVERRLWRGWIGAQRARDRYGTTVLVVGSRNSARAMVQAFGRDLTTGYKVVGVCIPRDDRMIADPWIAVGDRFVPVVGDDAAVLDAVCRIGVDAVAVTATDKLGPADFRWMAWEFDAIGVELIVAPGLVGVAGARLTNCLIADMPMVHVERPQYDRAKCVRKSLFDFGFALFAVLALAPVLLAVAAAVKSTSVGPVFYLSERIGRDGRPFRMIKFRSMYADADAQADDLIAGSGGNPLFFKLENDPRITPVGKVIRKYSLDELPQFFNVLRGEMSVVGPRPQVRREVDSYDGVMRRRLLVKPGVTGLWQVSGRSDLSLEDAIRLDQSYLENWSMVLDLLLIAKTVSVVARGNGAY
ncbi:sugar transferase [Nocardia cyriacigeorgica]|nr:sugar transferase [Nocardia cyriacigeorgica]